MRHAVRNRSLVRRAALLALIPAGLAGCGGGDGAPPADTVFKNGKVVTVDGTSSVAQGFAVRAGRFVAASWVGAPSSRGFRMRTCTTRVVAPAWTCR